MLINNKNIDVFSAKLIDREISTIYINSSYDWLSSALEGTLLNQKYDYKDIKVTFLIKETQEDLAYKRISALTEALKTCQIKFDDIDLIFPCFLIGSQTPQRLKNGKFKITYTLKNDWGIGEKITQSFDLTTVNCKQIKVQYILHWQNTMDYYIDCFSKDEQEQMIGEEKVWINLETLDSLIAESGSWDQLFLNLGVDLQAYHPNNALLGTTWIQQSYNESNVKQIIKDGVIKVIYMKFHKDGYPDFPEAYYPSLVWTTTDLNKYFIDLGVGIGWDIRDISIYVTGRYFSTLTNGNGCIVGANSDMPFNIAFNNPDAIIETDKADTQRYRYQVIETSSGGGGDVIFQTLESISSLPLRTYGFKSSKDSAAPIIGYCDVLFNGTTLDRIPMNPVILTKNLSLLYGNQGIGKYIDAARVQVYYKGELMVDAIPIDGNIKNGFINSYDTGFYDIVNMKFLPWVNYVTNEVGPHPEDIMDPDVSPEPPIEGKEYTITFNANGGQLSDPTTVTTVNGRLSNLPTPSRDEYVFKGWFTAATGGTQVSIYTVFTSDTILYAQWILESELVTHTITLVPAGGILNTSDTIVVYHGSTVNLPTPFRTNYIFKGWFTESTGGTQFTNTTKVNDDIILYAQWIESESGGGEVSNITTTIVDINGNIINNNDSVYENTKIMLVASDTGATIKYTLDGTDPRNGITYTSYITINEETVIRAISEKNGIYGPEIYVNIKIQQYIPPAEQGKILQYDEVAPGSFELQIGATTTPADWDIDPPRALLPFAAVYSIPNVPGSWQYYSKDWMEQIRTGTLNDGRAYIILNVTTPTSKTGAYIKFTPENGDGTITQNFKIRSLS